MYWPDTVRVFSGSKVYVDGHNISNIYLLDAVEEVVSILDGLGEVAYPTPFSYSHVTLRITAQECIILLHAMACFM